MSEKNKIIGITERHGIAQEYINYPPQGYQYEFIDRKPHILSRIVTSSAKGFFKYYEDPEIDIVEAPIFPAHTKQNCIYTPAEFSGTANFGLFGLPLPRSIRLKLIEQVFKRDNFKKILFKSQAGLNTLSTYAGQIDADIRAKCEVVSPCISLPELAPKKAKDDIIILFVGDFFRKGGANVVDAFEQLQTKYQHIKLQIIGNTQLDTHNQQLYATYQKKIANNPNIVHTKVTRAELFKDIYPKADIFVSPTYQETFGFAILEAMAFGLPVLSTAHFAIPEIIEDGKSGVLIETQQFDFIRRFKGYHVEKIPSDFHQYMNEQIYSKLEQLIVDETLRKSLSEQARLRCQDKFSTRIRANKMKVIYDDILS